MCRNFENEKLQKHWRLRAKFADIHPKLLWCWRKAQHQENSRYVKNFDYLSIKLAPLMCSLIVWTAKHHGSTNITKLSRPADVLHTTPCSNAISLLCEWTNRKEERKIGQRKVERRKSSDVSLCLASDKSEKRLRRKMFYERVSFLFSSLVWR